MLATRAVKLPVASRGASWRRRVKWSLAVSCTALFLLSGCGSSVSDPNQAPVAVAGGDIKVPVGQTATLDGSASYDPEGKALTFQWEILARPIFGIRDLTSDSGEQVELMPDAPGVWVIALTVSDGELASSRDVVQVRALAGECDTDEECEDDGLYCTVGGRCVNGACVYDSRDCSDFDDQCNDGVCNEDADRCEGRPREDGTPCQNDGLFCTGPEQCQSGNCVSMGNPCGVPENCDEENDVCAGCGDGEVVGAEDCDPGAPQNDHCCNPATCAWTAAGEADPQEYCSGAAECYLDVCDGGGGCTTAVAPEGTSCGDPSDTLCDNADTCDAFGNCQANLEPDTTECRPSAGDCDIAEYCDGMSPACPGDALAPNTTVCRPSVDADCDPAEYCDEVSVDCPVDQHVLDNTPCTDDTFFCTGEEQCQGGICVSMGNPCAVAADCDEVSDVCGACGDGVVSAGMGEECDPGAPRNDHCCNVGDCTWAADGDPDPQGVCSLAGVCEVDVCDGGGGCKIALAPETTPCGSPSDTACDNADTCDAFGNCRANLEPDTTLCRISAGDCDPAEYCDGVNVDCPTNDLEPVTTECRVSEGDCDPAEYCDGSNPTCPANELESAGVECRPAAGDCDVAEDCDGTNATCPDDGFAPEFTPCTDGPDPCLTGDTCDANGNCQDGAVPKDADSDGHVDDACVALGGDDCDDNDLDVNPGMTEGPVCDPNATCYDLKDNDCDTDTDTADVNCQATGFICVHGPTDPVVTGAPGDTLTVRLDNFGYDPDSIVCYTDTSRLLPPVNLLANDFEVDFTGFSISGPAQVTRQDAAQNPGSLGSWGVKICSDADLLITDPIDTTARTRIQLRYASLDISMGNDDFLITEYSPDGADWYVLDIMGEGYDPKWQWFTHILPPRCEGVTNLWIRFRNKGGGNGNCVYIDDVSIDDLPDPTVSWTVLANHFEPSEGNTTADECDGETIVHFTTQGEQDGDICLVAAAQNSATGGVQGVRIDDNDPSWLKDADVDTTYVPDGSDLVSEFYMREFGNLENNKYQNAWYYDGTTRFRMNGVGVDTRVDYDWFRFVWEQSGIGVDNAEVSFNIPNTSAGGDGEGIYLDDYELSWYRASHDVIGAFTDQGDGTYTANIQSDLGGTANVTCIYYGTVPPLVTDGMGDNSPPSPVGFTATYGSLEFYLDDCAEASPVNLGAFTVECWGKLDTDQPGAQSYEWIPLVEQADLAQLDVDGYGLSLVVFNRHVVGTIGSWGNLFEGTTTVTNNEWHHFAVTYDGNDMSIYLDGVFDGTKNYGVALDLSGANRLEIGSSIDGGSDEWFGGNMDEVRIWDYARTGAEIVGDMYSELTGSEAGLAHYWKFNESAGQTSQDFAGSNDAQLGSTAAADASDPAWSPDRPFVP